MSEVEQGGEPKDQTQSSAPLKSPAPATRSEPTTENVARPGPIAVAPEAARRWFSRLPATAREWLGEPDFSIYFVVFMIAAAILFLRFPTPTGQFVFDEQEAILANPYVRGHQPWLDAFKRDFWGLLPDRSIGSYRPIPNFLWRALWRIQEWRGKGQGSPVNVPFVWFNIVFHATNAALLASFVRGLTRRVGLGWVAGAFFCACAILTEAVSGIVGIADVLGGVSLLLALWALTLPPAGVVPAVFAATLFGLLSKESAVVNVGLVPFAALAFGPWLRGDGRTNTRGTTWLAALLSLVGAGAALGAYFWIRHRYFHIEYTADATKTGLAGLGEKLRVYVGAPNLPVDPFNNPLADPLATTGQRVSGALRVYFRGFVQVLVPNRLSPDYSFPQEPLPPTPFFPEAILGAILLVCPPLIGLLTLLRDRREHLWASRSEGEVEGPWARERALLAYALVVWPASFFPISNIPKALPTVRAERFWYTPALATSLALAVILLLLARRRWTAVVATGGALLAIQTAQTRRHANDFRDDLSFWRSASIAVPNSAKAHLNYSVMLGARAPEIWKWTTTQAQEARLVENIRAAELAPKWDMAFIYVGDTLCQLSRMDEAWEWYKKGFRIGSNNSGLIALALQCMSDHNALLGKEKDALAMLDEPGMTGTWLAYLVRDTVDRERKCRGVDLTVTDEPQPIRDTFDDDEVADAPTTSASASASASSAKASASSAKASASSAKASASVAASTSASASVAASTSASGSTGGGAAAPSPPRPQLPPCGVDPKYRPRGLDGDPKSD